MRTRAWLSCLLLLSSASITDGQEIVPINVAIRDFFDIHPNMEIPLTFNVFQAERGIVQPTLGEDRKPVFNSAGAPFVTVTNEEDFDQWYRDVPDVNLTATVSLPFSVTDQGGMAFVDEVFFPIDNFLLGNQGLPRNFHFTMELHGHFTYSEGDVVRFTGDDDFWLYLDNQLAIDLGGVHDRLSGAVRLDDLGLTSGEVYSFDLFFAERHTSQSRFTFETSFLLEQPLGDVNADGQLSVDDLDFLCSGLATGSQFIGFDLSGDGVVDDGDIQLFLEQASALPGDSDLNGAVDFADFLTLSVNFGLDASFWSEGDFDCNFVVEFPDFLLLAANFGQSVATVAAVPEPGSGVVLGGLLLAWPRGRRHRAKVR